MTNASRKSTLVTDESKLYTTAGKEFAAHQTMLHTGREYVNKDGFTTNNVENFFGSSSAACAARSFTVVSNTCSAT